MGACMSRAVEYPNEVHPNLFTVAIVDRSRSALAEHLNNNSNNLGSGSNSKTRRRSTDSGGYGQLEVTSTDLIYHCRGMQAISWPLHYVRRYGYENNLFSFESGRRCERQGIFTFRCRKAQQLFLSVQNCIQEQGTEDRSNRSRRPRSTDEYLGPSIASLSAVSGDHRSASRDRLSSRNSQTTDDSESVSQVFMEVTPNVSGGSVAPSSASILISSHQHPGSLFEPHFRTNGGRRSALDSTSSRNSLGGGSIGGRQRPKSVETTANVPELIFNSSEGVQAPKSPPDAYYVNIDPKQPSSSSSQIAKACSTLRVEPSSRDDQDPGSTSGRIRSASCDGQAAARRQSAAAVDQSVGGATTGRPPAPLPYVNFPPPGFTPASSSAFGPAPPVVDHQSESAADDPDHLDYALLDVGGANCNGFYAICGGGGGANHKTTDAHRLADWSSSAPPASVQHNSAPFQQNSASLHHNPASNSASSPIRGAGGGASIGPDAGGPTSNYAKIDCAKTRALRDTTAQHRIATALCHVTYDESNPPPVRRTRHDSAFDYSINR